MGAVPMVRLPGGSRVSLSVDTDRGLASFSVNVGPPGGPARAEVRIQPSANDLRALARLCADGAAMLERPTRGRCRECGQYFKIDHRTGNLAPHGPGHACAGGLAPPEEGSEE